MLALSSIMLLATSIFSFFYNTLTAFISTAVRGDLLVTVFLKGVLLFLMWKYRHSLLSAFSRVTNSPVGKISREISNSQSVQKLKERLSGSGKAGLQLGKSGLKVGAQFSKGGLKMGKDKLSENLKSLRKQSPLVEKVAEKGDGIKNRMNSIKEHKKSSVNALKEKGNRTLAKLYGVRANAFKEGRSERNVLEEKQKLRDKEAKKFAGQKKASRESIQRLKEERLKRGQKPFKENQEGSVKQKMQTPKMVNSEAVGRRKTVVNNPKNEEKISKVFRSKQTNKLKAKKKEKG